MGFTHGLGNRRLARLVPAVAAGAVVALVLSACNSSSGSQATSKASISVGHSALGAFLVDGMGTSVYLFEKDVGPNSTCYGACATTWPPVTTTGQPSVGGGAHAALLSTTTRTDGVKQLDYAGHPLYYYSGDNGPGTTAGEGLQSFGAGWDVLNPAGHKIEKGG